MDSLIRQTDWSLAIVLGISAIVFCVLWRIYPRFAAAKHRHVETRLESEIRELVIDRANNTVSFVVRILNMSNTKLTLKSINKPKIRLDRSAPVFSSILITSTDMDIPECGYISVRLVTNIPTDVVLPTLRDKRDKRECAYWDFDLTFDLRSSWGDFTFHPDHDKLTFTQIPRIGGV